MRLHILLVAALLAAPGYGGIRIAGSRAAASFQRAATRDRSVIDVPDSQVVARYGDWEVVQGSTLVGALTHNRDGSLFGLLCGKSCTYYVNAAVECDTGEVYTGMISGGGGALSLTLRCAHVREEGHQYAVLLIDEDLSDALQDSDEISITLPLDNGRVETKRFSMAGAAEAQQEMLDMATDEDDDADVPALTV